ncbi:MAG: hypothetical protein ABIT01_12625 [Thermoanaerobaculia bacterium]
MPLLLGILTGLAALTAACGRFPHLMGGAPVVALGLFLIGAGALAVTRRSVTRNMTPVLLLAGVLALYLGNGRLNSSGDNQGIRALPAAIVAHHGLDISGITPFTMEPLHYSGIRRGQVILPSFPLGTSFLAVPFYAVFADATDGRALISRLDEIEKVAAAGLVVLALLFLFLGLRSRFGPRAAFLGTACVALASPIASTAAQGLWSSTGALFLLCAGLGILLRRSHSSSLLFIAGALFGLSAFARPTAVLPALAFGAVLLARRPRIEAAAASLGFACGLLICGALNLLLLGHPFGPYFAMNRAPRSWTTDVLPGALGSLLSPSRGLLVWCPWILAGAALLVLARGPRLRGFAAAALASVIPTWLLIAGYRKWWGGECIGPRLFLEAMPFLAVLVCGVVAQRGRPFLKSALGALVLLSGGTHILATYRPAAGLWSGMVDVDSNTRACWSLTDSQLAATWLPRWSPSDIRGRGFIGNRRRDNGLSGSIDQPAPGQAVSGRLVIRGWARIAGDDLEILAELDASEARAQSSVRRFPRPDVCAAFPALGNCDAAGWEIDFGSPRPNQRGDVSVHAVFRSKDGRFRRYPSVTFVWKPDA